MITTKICKYTTILNRNIIVNYVIHYFNCLERPEWKDFKLHGHTNIIELIRFVYENISK